MHKIFTAEKSGLLSQNNPSQLYSSEQYQLFVRGIEYTFKQPRHLFKLLFREFTLAERSFQKQITVRFKIRFEMPVNARIEHIGLLARSLSETAKPYDFGNFLIKRGTISACPRVFKRFLRPFVKLHKPHNYDNNTRRSHRKQNRGDYYYHHIVVVILSAWFFNIAVFLAARIFAVLVALVWVFNVIIFTV